MTSVVIPAFNEEKNIGDTLQSLVNQKYAKKFEVILVDNNSTDGTVKTAKKYSKKLNLRIIKETKQGRGAAKARGANEAKGDILAYLDADSRALPNWLSVIEKSFKDQSVVAVTGPWAVYDLPDGFTKWFLHNFQEIAMLPVTVYLGHPDLNGMNMALSKSAYKRSGGFDASLNIHDDFDLARRLNKLGKVKYTKKLKVLTSGRRYRRGILAGLLSYHKHTLNFLIGKPANLENLR